MKRASARSDPIEVPGDSLISLLETSDLRGARVVVNPPPTSWAPLKPAIRRLRAVIQQGESSPSFSGYPLCAIGSEWRELRVDHEARRFSPHPACEGCGLQDECSPPAVWHPDLQPFGFRESGASFGAYRDRLREVLGLTWRGELDEIVDAHLSHRPGLLARAPYILEPSVVAGEGGIERSVRLVIFHGPTPRDPKASRESIEGLLESLRAMHRLLGQGLPEPIADIIREVGPCRLPVGFEARENDPVRLKVYIEEPLGGGETLRRAADRLFSIAGRGTEASRHGLDWSRAGMLGLGLTASRPDSLKVYVRSNPATNGEEAGIKPLGRDHNLVKLSSERAYLVVDLLHVERRPAKWDLPVREHLISGRSIPELVPEGRARDELARLVDHNEFRSDAVAVGLRGSSRTVYFEIG